MSRFFETRTLALGCGLIATAQVLSAQTSALYLSAGDRDRFWVLQGGAFTLNWAATSHCQFALAVSGDVRTIGCTDVQAAGAQYSLAGAFTGTNYNNPFPVSHQVFDGTTDGVNNYTVDAVSGTVFSLDRSWASPTALFTVAVALRGRPMGITYDPTNNSLWMASQIGTGDITNYSLDGSVLSSFNAPLPGCINSVTHVNCEFIAALAFDPVDQTLWFFDRETSVGSGPPTFYQYDRSGTLLSTQVHPEVAGYQFLGGEFAEGVAVSATPEPTSIFLVATGLLAVCAIVRQGTRDNRSSQIARK